MLSVPSLSCTLLRAESRHLSSGTLKARSRREELNAPSTDYDSVALTLSYTGIRQGMSKELSDPLLH